MKILICVMSLLLLTGRTATADNLDGGDITLLYLGAPIATAAVTAGITTAADGWDTFTPSHLALGLGAGYIALAPTLILAHPNKEKLNRMGGAWSTTVYAGPALISMGVVLYVDALLLPDLDQNEHYEAVAQQKRIGLVASGVGLAVVGVHVATWLMNDGEEQEQEREQSSLRVSAVPSSGGASVGLSGNF